MMSPELSWTEGDPSIVAQHVPSVMTWYEIKCCTPGRTLDAISFPAGAADAHGACPSTSKKIAPTRWIPRKTSDSVSMLAAMISDRLTGSATRRRSALDLGRFEQ